MIKQVLHKIFTFSLALLVLFSTVSFTVEKHFCGDVLVDSAIFVDVNKCELEALEMLQNKTCCKDEIDVIKGQNELTRVSFDDLDFQQQELLVAFTQAYVFSFESLEKLKIPHKNYSPPNLVTDIQVLDQVFII